MKSSNTSAFRLMSPANETARPLPEEGTISPFARRIVGVVGLGRMGEAFALNLVADGHRVLVFDRDPTRVAARGQARAQGGAALRGLAACDLVVTSLPDDDALTAVPLRVGGLVKIMRAGAVHVSMSTISP